MNYKPLTINDGIHQMQLLTIIFIFNTLLIWAYLSVYFNQGKLPYSEGFRVYASFQWLMVLINICFLTGWWGLLIFFGIIVLFPSFIQTPNLNIYWLIFGRKPNANTFVYGFWGISVFPILVIITITNGFPLH